MDSNDLFNYEMVIFGDKWQIRTRFTAIYSWNQDDLWVLMFDRLKIQEVSLNFWFQGFEGINERIKVNEQAAISGNHFSQPRQGVQLECSFKSIDLFV